MKDWPASAEEGTVGVVCVGLSQSGRRCVFVCRPYFSAAVSVVAKRRMLVCSLGLRFESDVVAGRGSFPFHLLLWRPLEIQARC